MVLGACAWAARGQVAAAPPSSMMSSRLFNLWHCIGCPTEPADLQDILLAAISQRVCEPFTAQGRFSPLPAVRVS
jgi:hypothetical protein